MKIAIVHDDLMQWGGAERVLQAICEVFPEAPIFTAVYDSTNSLLDDNFQKTQIVSSFLQKIPGYKTLYKALLPLYPLAFESFDFSEYDLVISQTTRFAKAIITKPETVHLSLCHTPPRFLWHLSGLGEPTPFKFFNNWLRLFDVVSSRRVDVFLAGSVNAQRRIAKIYRAKARLCYPFVDLDHAQIEPFDGGYYLIIARLTSYKRIDIALEAFNQNGRNLKIVGSGPELIRLKRQAKSNISFLESVSENLLQSLLAGAKAVIVTAEEDFGMVSLEAQAFGKPVLCFGQGGALETVIDHKTGLFFNQQTAESLNQTLWEFDQLEIRASDCLSNANHFSKKRFQNRIKELVEEFVGS